MRIAFTRREPLHLADGITAFVLSLANEFIARGHSVHAFTGTFTDLGVTRSLYEHRHLPSITSGLSRADGHSEILRYWLSSGRDELNAFSPEAVIVNGALPFRFRYPSCTVAHDVEPRWNYGGLARRIYKSATYRMTRAVVATCSEIQRELAHELIMPPQRIELIPTCIDPSLYQNSTLEARELAILHMGTVSYKNPLTTITAFSRLRCKSAVLYITGDSNAAVLQALNGMPAQARERVVLLGKLPGVQLRQLLSRVRAVSVPSIYRVPVASPTVLEAFASGTPVVVSPSISTDLVRDGENGFRVAATDVGGFTAALDLLLQDDAVWVDLHRGTETTARHYFAPEIADRYLDLFAGMGSTASQAVDMHGGPFVSAGK
jgi:glycosyltransferase involved in cell wall biosynthesis